MLLDAFDYWLVTYDEADREAVSFDEAQEARDAEDDYRYHEAKDQALDDAYNDAAMAEVAA